LLACKQAGKKGILTFGGAYSNHIHATAYAANIEGLASIGMIRGEHTLPLNPTLHDAEQWGMQLHYLSRTDYQQKTSESFLARLAAEYRDFYLIPEGGDNAAGLKGCREIVNHIDAAVKHIVVAAGTGTTAAGIILGAAADQHIHVVSALKGDFLRAEIQQKLDEARSNWQLHDQFHFGGYAKWTAELIEFMNAFYRQTAVPLDPIYTAKAAYALIHLCKTGLLSNEEPKMLIHTGGLQGIRGFNKRYPNMLSYGGLVY
jgi:1-aminocyclopropane-1-carboxylate deaminase